MNNNQHRTNMKPRWLSFLVLALLPWLPGCAKAEWPFEVQKAGNKIEVEYRAREHRGYYFQIRLGYKKRDQADAERVGKLAGKYAKDRSGNLIEPGVPILLRFKIYTIDASGEKLLLEQDVSELRTTSAGSGSYSKEIAMVILKPGRYRISVESLKDVPELIGTSVIFSIGIPAKTRPIS